MFFSTQSITFALTLQNIVFFAALFFYCNSLFALNVFVITRRQFAENNSIFLGTVQHLYSIRLSGGVSEMRAAVTI